MPERTDYQPKYRHYKPKDLAVVRLAGRDVYLGKFDSPESGQKYYRVLAEWKATGSAPGPAPASASAADTPTVAELILRFWGHAERHYRRADGTPTDELDAYRLTLRPLRQL